MVDDLTHKGLRQVNGILERVFEREFAAILVEGISSLDGTSKPLPFGSKFEARPANIIVSPDLRPADCSSRLIPRNHRARIVRW